MSGRARYVLLFFLAAAPYLNTLWNGYVLDDASLFTENTYVQQGWAGIPALLTRDAYASEYEQSGISLGGGGGRYRPLSLVTFAMEVGLFGEHAWLSHLVNVLLYGLAVAAAFALVTRLAPGDAVLFWTAALLFAWHPIHTEVVANVKSRDEILSLLFMALAGLAAFRSLPLCGLAFALALLSKEYAVTLVVLVPWAGWILREPLRRVATFTAVLAGLLVVYIAVRVSLVGLSPPESSSLVNHPYLAATAVEAAATRLWVLADYLRMLTFPWPLAYDYSYNQVPYVTFGDPRVWFGLVFHVAAVWVTVVLACRRSVAGFAGAWYLGTLALVSNFVVNAATIQAERLLFHPSFGAAVAAGAGVSWLWGRYPRARRPAMGIGILAGLVGIGLTVDRNRDWRDEQTLYLRDVRVIPNSAMANANAAAKCMDLYYAATDDAVRTGLFQAARNHAERGFGINPDDVGARLNLGLVRMEAGRLKEAGMLWRTVWGDVPGHPSRKVYAGHLHDAYLEHIHTAGRNQDWPTATRLAEEAQYFFPNSEPIRHLREGIHSQRLGHAADSR